MSCRSSPPSTRGRCRVMRIAGGRGSSMTTASRPLDVICLGRAAVDLYGQQVGGRLEDMQSFAKYLGGSSANLAAGLARLRLRPALLTRGGDQHLGSLRA